MPPFPPSFLTLACNPSPFCHQSFSSLLHCSSLFLFTNAFPSLISWNPSLITPHHRLSHLVHKCVINNSLHIQEQLFTSFRLTSFQRVHRNNAKKETFTISFSLPGENGVPLPALVKFVKHAFSYEHWEPFGQLIEPTLQLLQEQSDINSLVDIKTLQLMLALEPFYNTVKKTKKTPAQADEGETGPHAHG